MLLCILNKNVDLLNSTICYIPDHVNTELSYPHTTKLYEQQKHRWQRKRRGHTFPPWSAGTISKHSWHSRTPKLKLDRTTSLQSRQMLWKSYVMPSNNISGIYQTRNYDRKSDKIVGRKQWEGFPYRKITSRITRRSRGLEVTKNKRIPQ